MIIEKLQCMTNKMYDLYIQIRCIHRISQGNPILRVCGEESFGIHFCDENLIFFTYFIYSFFYLCGWYGVAFICVLSMYFCALVYSVGYVHVYTYVDNRGQCEVYF